MLLSLAFIPFLFVGSQEVAAQPGDDLRASYNNLKMVEDKKDTDETLKSAVATLQAANKVLKSPKPAAEGEVEHWKQFVEFAKEAETYAAYSIYATALRDHERIPELFEALYKESPGNKYVSDLSGLYIGAVSQKPGGANKAYDFASKQIARDPNNEDLLAVLADGAMSRKQWDKAAGYGTKLATVLGTHAKPEAMPAGDWEKRKTALIARGYYIAGISYATVNKFSLADKSLRAGLPFIKGDPALYGATMFYLGLANYNLARATQDKPRMKEALTFSEEAFKAGGQFAQLANQNVYGIKQELGKMR